jgi:Helicase HerA, central domain
MPAQRNLAVGGVRPLDGSGDTRGFELPADDLLTHGVVLGMTGSGKTGLLLVLVEEALRSRIPVVMIDVKGDLPNLLLTFPSLSAADLEPWVDEGLLERTGRSRGEVAAEEAQRWRERLATFGLGPDEAQELRARMAPRVLTPGMAAAEPLHVLSPLEQPGTLWSDDPETARESLSASISLLLRLLGRDADPTRSRDHVVLSVLAERRLKQGLPADVASLLGDVREPPVERMGALPIDEFLPKKERQALAAALNTLLASPTFESWRTGARWTCGSGSRRGPTVEHPP